jgi:hypothetical protein
MVLPSPPPFVLTIFAVAVAVRWCLFRVVAAAARWWRCCRSLELAFNGFFGPENFGLQVKRAAFLGVVGFEKFEVLLRGGGSRTVSRGGRKREKEKEDRRRTHRFEGFEVEGLDAVEVEDL